MSESDASYYQQHKDDPDEWEEVPAPPARRGKRRLDAMISVRFSPAELDILRDSAHRRGETVSTFIRTSALRSAHQSTPVGAITQGGRSTLSIITGPLMQARITAASIPSPFGPPTATGPSIHRTA
jgi:hypothetical protein